MARRRIGFWYRLAVVVIKPLLLLFTKRDWRGTENIPTSGGFVTAGDAGGFNLWAGQAHVLAREAPAGEIVRTLAAEAAAAARAAAERLSP